MKVINLVLSSILLTSLSACNSGTSGSNTNSNNLANNSTNSATIKAAYVDFTGNTSLIKNDGYAAANVLLFAFADVTTPTMSPSYVANITTAISAEQVGTINFLSIGGALGAASTFNSVGIANAISNITAQITSINSKLPTNKKITGVDLDLENDGWTADMINQLAYGFKQKGYLVSVAPQVYLANSNLGSNVDPTNPTNLGLTAYGASNVYQTAISSGNVDYIMAQTYNTGGWTVGGYSENSINFFAAISQALNSAVKTSCSTTSNTLCIPTGVKVVIGEPSNGKASGNENNIFHSNGSTPYNQANTLNLLNDSWTSVQQLYPHISGIMEWSLNNDYNIAGFGDVSASAGAFTSTIFGADPAPAPAPTLPYFILQVSNTGPNVAGKGAYSSATLVINGNYLIFGNQWNQPIAPGANQSWGTSTSAANPDTPGVIDSGNLDSVFSNNAASFTVSSIVINGYSSNSLALGTPTVQYACASGKNYTFQAGHSYNIMVNAAYGSCQINKVN